MLVHQERVFLGRDVAVTVMGYSKEDEIVGSADGFAHRGLV